MNLFGNIKYSYPILYEIEFQLKQLKKIFYHTQNDKEYLKNIFRKNKGMI